MSQESIDKNNPVPSFEVGENIIYSAEGKTLRLKASRPTQV